MSIKKAGGGQGPNLKKFRSDVSKLRGVGLVSKRVDARSQTPTRYMKGIVKKFNDVLEGRAQAVKVPRAVAKDYSAAYKTKGSRVVVPVEKGERARYRKKDAAIVGHRTGYAPGETIDKIFTRAGKTEFPETLPPGHVYSIPLGSGVRSFDTFSDAVLFMTPYETGPHSYRGSLGDWKNYLYIERYSDADEMA